VTGSVSFSGRGSFDAMPSAEQFTDPFSSQSAPTVPSRSARQSSIVMLAARHFVHELRMLPRAPGSSASETRRSEIIGTCDVDHGEDHFLLV
jgi:hypothetical protein